MSGRTSTTFKCSWLNQPTTNIRVPVAFKDELLNYARELDTGSNSEINKKIDEFIALKRKHSSKIRKNHFAMDSTQWIVFNEFYRWLNYQKKV